MIKLSLLSLVLTSFLVTATQATPIGKLSAPADPGVVNKERILYWAVQNGELPADASTEQKSIYLQRFLSNVRAAHKLPVVVAKAQQALAKKAAQPARPSKTGAENKTVKVLTVLVDFPDLPYNSNGLSRTDTPMYYADYSVAHYRNLMYSTSGYAGPNGQNLQSGYQYYQAESGASLFYTGDVFGWVRANNNADYYGGHGPDDNKDQRAEELIIEAVEKAIAANPAIDLAEYDIEDQYDVDLDGNRNEPDGVIDHVNVFHSSIGEEAGGGRLSANAIWSHRYFVGNLPVTLAGSSYKIYGYTIQPIDAGAGVVVHEFGHDLGLADEYDTATEPSTAGSPVGMWSVMSGGSWAGAVAGTEPTGFSPLGRDLFQQWYGGNWINQTVVDLATLQTEVRGIDLVDAISHNSTINQIRIELPAPVLPFSAPYAGLFQFHSGQGHLLNNRLSFPVTVANADDAAFELYAKWKIELDYDYARVLVNGTAIPGTSTINTLNPQQPGIQYYLTGNSGANWQLLSFSLAAYNGQTVTISIEYVTDPAAGDFGLVVDDLRVTGGGTTAFSADAESAGQTTLAGFSRVGSTLTGLQPSYYVQLRSHRGLDLGLQRESYQPGMLLWFADPNYLDNNVGEHPGHGFLGVVDADQTLVLSGGANADSETQVRDAPFRRMAQIAHGADQSLTAIPAFDDRYDYSSPSQPQSGMILPQHKLVMALTAQADDSSTARIILNADPAAAALTASISRTINQLAVSFTGSASGGVGALSYLWNFGDNTTGTELAPSHSFTGAGTYAVSLTVTDSRGVSKVVTDSITVSAPPAPVSTGGGGGGSFAVTVLLVLLGARKLRVQ